MRMDLRRYFCRAGIGGSARDGPHCAAPFEDGADTLKDILKAGLQALDWREAENLEIEERYSDDDPASLPRWRPSFWLCSPIPNRLYRGKDPVPADGGLLWSSSRPSSSWSSILGLPRHLG